MRFALIALVVLAGCERRPDAREAKRALESTSALERERGAAALRKIYAKDPQALGDHGEQYWVERLAGLRGASSEETARILAGGRSMGSEGGGGGSTDHFRLDDFWSAELFRDDRRGTIWGYEPPRRNVVHVDVAPPPKLTGTWTTYFVNGAVYDARELEGGVPRRDREFHDNGALRREYLYVDGKLDGAFVTRFADGSTEWEESYAKGKKVGVERWFHRNGKLRQEEHWVDGVRDGRSTFYGDSGSVVQCIDYRAGAEVSRGCSEGHAN